MIKKMKGKNRVEEEDDEKLYKNDVIHGRQNKNFSKIENVFLMIVDVK